MANDHDEDDGKTASDRSKSYAQTIAAHYRAAFDAKMPFLNLWLQCQAFYNGNHYDSSASGLTRAVKAPSWKIKLTDNRIPMIVHQIVAKLSMNAPSFECQPNNTTRGASEKAKVGSLLLRFLHEHCELPVVTEQALYWAALTGTGHYYWQWNKEAHPFEVPIVEALSPFDVYPTLNATSQLNCRRMVILRRMKRDDAVDRFGSGVLEDIPKAASDDDIWRRRLTGYFTLDSADDVVLFESQEPATASTPKGRWCWSTGTKIIEENPLPMGRYTISTLRLFPVAGRFWGRGAVEDPIPLQRELNRTESQSVEIRNLFTNPQWVAPKGSIGPDDIVNRPDAKIMYDPNFGGKPEIQPAQPIPSTLFEMATMFENGIKETSGQHDVSKGNTPGGADSGRAFEFLADQDSSKLSLAVTSHERAIQALGQGLYDMWRLYQKEDISVQVAGADRRYVVQEVIRDDLDNLTVKVVAGSSSPSKPAAMRAMAERLLTAGVLPKEKAPMILRELLGNRLIDSITDDDCDPRIRAREENHMLLDAGLRPMIHASWWEDQNTHINEHLAFMEGERYAQCDEPTQKAFRVHLAEHYHLATQAAQGVPLYAEELGMQSQPPPQPGLAQQSTQGGPPALDNGVKPPESGAYDGGNPELNRAVNPGGAGVDHVAESTGA